MNPSEPSWRKPFGVLAMLAMISLWLVLAATVAGWLGPLPKPAELALYLALGIVWIWVLPMRRLLVWMETGRWRLPVVSKEATMAVGGRYARTLDAAEHDPPR